MRSTLVFPPRTSPTYMPLGIACLAAALRNQNIEVDLFDANLEFWEYFCDHDAELSAMRAFSRGALSIFLDSSIYAKRWSAMGLGRARFDRVEKLAAHYLAGEGLDMELEKHLARQTGRLEQTDPEVVGFSVMYLDQLPFALAHARYLREVRRAGCRIVFGGAAMSALSPVELLNAAPYVDWILTGEGELSLSALLRGSAPKDIPGCFYRSENGTLASALPGVVPDLAVIAAPDFSQLARQGGYFNPVPVLPIYGCRGCKWRRCRFCSHNQSFGRHRARPAMAVAMEMQERARQFGCRHFYVVDQYVDPIFLNELSDAILALGVECRFQIMARTIPEYTPSLLRKAAEAGCCWISWGMESGSQRMLDLMNKGTRLEPALRVIQDAAQAGISNLLMMIFGAPGSNEESENETFTFLDRAWPYIDGMTASAFVLFDHTAFGTNPTQYGLEILGRNQILNLEGRPIYDMKLRFRRDGEDGRNESPLAGREIERWERRRAWLPELPFHGRLCCEHYLIYADAHQANFRPGTGGIRTA